MYPYAFETIALSGFTLFMLSHDCWELFSHELVTLTITRESVIVTYAIIIY